MANKIDTGSGGILTPTAIALLMIKEGWFQSTDNIETDPILVTGVAVALAESGGNPKADNPSSTAQGLWQVMVSVHGDKIAGRDINDPVINTDVAHTIYKDAGGWTPWEVYNNKSHLIKLPAARTGVKQAARYVGESGTYEGGYDLPGPIDIPNLPDLPDVGLPDIPNPLAALSGFFSGLTSADLWLRIASFVVGAVLVIMAFTAMSGITPKKVLGAAL